MNQIILRQYQLYELEHYRLRKSNDHNKDQDISSLADSETNLSNYQHLESYVLRLKALHPVYTKLPKLRETMINH
ncbi:hypothetical protein TTHERM_00155610 (macronuclear) [Tetrahymena thermophila SB210]|uniref:Uncharacterized protein n=1 Tax=Tetrahymena thermophila (strain SB210) TaxID=312017 RepID=Q22WH5_TETTS|nr:hypothetical protein TTHERM_00155610 [Tetrahymena thermophila SB210]EAR89442.1 hypothetical protein TTHERM_00155610 [Tetrahymena thermophila SB210]|eukprot:XP_001009687.1 hypothetical protein TTHERM_00155610 [Tetrahymena thermophila SB210]